MTIHCSVERLTLILFSVRTTKQPFQLAMSAATALMVANRAWAPGSRKRICRKITLLAVAYHAVNRAKTLGQDQHRWPKLRYAFLDADRL